MGMWDTQKADVRKAMRSRLKAVPEELKKEWDERILSRLLELLEDEDAEWIYGYMSLSWEPGTEAILKTLLEKGRRVALPRVTAKPDAHESYMEFYEITSLDQLTEGAYHIMEPGAQCRKAEIRDAFMLVPGMAFTGNGKRLGKGGGYYDKFLALEPRHKTAALAYGFQIMEDLPVMVHDRTVDLVITPEKIFS